MSFFPTQGNGIFGQGSFTIDQNSTPEMIKAKRAQIAALMPQYGKAKYVGEGFGQLFQGIATGKKNRELDKFEGERRQEAAGQFNGIMSGGGGSRPSGPLSVLGMRPDGAAQAPGPDQQIADDTMGAIGKPKQGGDREAFIQEMMPHAQRVAQQTGLDPRLIIAQAAQETGWGKSAPGNNYFGIKSHGQAGGNNLATNEVINGETVRMNQSFRGYEGMGDSVDGYAEFLQKNPRYKQMLGAGDLDGQLAALGASGYATDPNYANSVGSIARSIQVPQGSFAPGQGQQVAQNGGGYQPPQNDGRLNELMMAAQNPWLSPQQRGVINAQIQQVQGQQEAMQQRQWSREDDAYNRAQDQADPLYQLKLRDAQAPKTQFVKGIGLINSGTGEVVNDFGGAAATADGGEYGLTPQYITTPDGSLQMVQISKTGGPAKVVDLPEGAALQKGVQKLDLGTSYQWYNNVTGQPIGEPVPKDLEGAAAATARGAATGKSQGETDSELAEMERNMPGLLEVVDQLGGLSEDATYTYAGRAYNEARKQAGLDPTEGALARAEYIAVVDNQVLPLLRQTFGAAFTEKEGATLRATLGDPNKSPSEKKAVLNAFIEQKKRDLMALRGGPRIDTTQPAPSGGNSGAATHVFNPATGKVEPAK